jgi:hypothetical protein
MFRVPAALPYVEFRRPNGAQIFAPRWGSGLSSYDNNQL